ncbi:MAG: lipopolysaccharide biosynthesis protein [Mucilaginibacter sp.]
MLSKILAVFQNKHFLSLTGNVIMSGLGMLNLSILLRSLSISDAGIWAYFSLVITLIDSIRSGFLTTAFIKFYSGSDAQREQDVVGSSWFVAGCITLLLVLVNIPLLFFANRIQDEGYKLLIHLFSICFVCMLPWFIASCVVTAEQRFDKLLYIRLVNVGGFTIYIILLIVFKKMNISWVVFAYIFSHFVTSIFCLIKGWARIDTFGKRTKATIMEIYHFGKYSLGTSLSANLWNFSDSFMLKTILGGPAGYAAVAIFGLGQNLMQTVEILLRSFAATALPSAAAAFNRNDPDSVIYITKKYVGMITFMLIPIMLFGWLLADLPIYIIGGGKYLHTPAANVFRILLAFAIISPADRFFALTIDVINKPKINFYKLLIMLATNIVFNYAGLMIFPNAYGVTVTTFSPILVGLIVGYYTLNHWRRFSFWDTFVVGWRETKLTLAGIKQKFLAKG